MEQPTLRALEVSEILDRALRIYRAKFISLLGIVAAMMIPQGILLLISTLYLSDTRIVQNLTSLIFQNLAMVALIVAISNVNLGKDFTIRSAYSEGTKHFWSVIGASFLIGLAIAVPMILFGICVVTAVPRAFWIILLFIPPAIFISTRWSVTSSAIVLENNGSSAGLRRSWDLTADFFWRVFGTSFLAQLLAILLMVIPVLFLNYLLGLTGLSFKAIELIGVVVQQLGQILILPFTIAVQVLIYYDLRIRKEGFDLLLRTEEQPEAAS
ncbi:MAG: hypothetical protein QM730_01315 [Anaerolineales bacterium]